MSRKFTGARPRSPRVAGPGVLTDTLLTLLTSSILKRPAGMLSSLAEDILRSHALRCDGRFSSPQKMYTHQ